MRDAWDSSENVRVEYLDERFVAVFGVFARLVEEGLEPGASVSVHHAGRLVVSLVGGWQDSHRMRPMTPSTLAMVHSAGKPMAALAALRAVADGILTLDDPIIRWWPAYGRGRKETTTLRHILSHTAGMPSFSGRVEALDPLDKSALIADLAASPALSAPGAVIAEHALTYGHLIDGLLLAAGAPDIRTAVGEIAEYMGIELWFGVPVLALPRVADLEIIDENWIARAAKDPGVLGDVLRIPSARIDPRHTNSELSRLASFPANGLFTNAVSLARFYDDVHREDGAIAGILGPELRREYLRPQATGYDAFVGSVVSWSLGLRVDGGEIGMGGMGGSCGWYSPGLDYSFAYVTRGLGTFQRVDAIAAAVEAAIRDG